MSSQSSTVHAPPRLLEHPPKKLKPAALGLALSQNVQSGCPLAQVDSGWLPGEPGGRAVGRDEKGGSPEGTPEREGDSSSSKVVRLLSQFLGVLSTLDSALYFLAHSNQGTLCLQA